MKVTAVLNQKGGCGKTTIALHLAAALAQRHRVLLINADPQGTALDWQSGRATEATFPIVSLPTETLHRELPRIGAAFDHIVIDGAPRLEKLTRSAVAAADVVLIPVQPSGPDIWATTPLIEMVLEAQISKPALMAAFVVTRLKGNTALGRAVLNLLADQPFPVLPALIHDRVSYAESVTGAATVLETHPRSAAAAEVALLCAIVERMHEGRPVVIEPDQVRSLDRLQAHLDAMRESNTDDQDRQHRPAA